jgi:hypothetical protein
LVSPARSVRWGACRAGWCRGGGQGWSSSSRGLACLSFRPCACLSRSQNRLSGAGLQVGPPSSRERAGQSRHDRVQPPPGAPAVTGSGQASPCVCHCWLPSRLPDIWFASLTFPRSNSVPSRHPNATVSAQLDPVRVTARTVLSRLPRLRTGLALLNLCPLFIPVLYRITPPRPGRKDGMRMIIFSGSSCVVCWPGSPSWASAGPDQSGTERALAPARNGPDCS